MNSQKEKQKALFFKFEDRSELQETPYKGYSFKGASYLFTDKNFLKGEPLLDEKVLGPLSHINIFTGANNSGKSRLLRYLAFNEQGKFYSPKGQDLETAYGEYDFHCFVDRVSSYHPEFIDLRQISFHKDRKLRLKDFFKPEIKKFFQYVWEDKNIFNHVASSDTRALKASLNNDFSLNDQQYLKRCFIPIFRGLTNLSKDTSSSNEDSYKEKFIQLYQNSAISSSVFGQTQIFTGLGLHSQLKEDLLGSHSQREGVKSFENFLSEEFFQGKTVTLIPNNKDHFIKISLGDDRDLKMHEVGDGLEQLIVLLYPIFTAEEATSFFIEEPETHMHPGLQRKFLETLHQDRFKHHQFFLTSHSNHLLDMTLDYSDMSIFLFQKQGEDSDAKFNVTPLQGPEQSVLQELGINNSSVFLTNSTVWIEGPTDRIYIKALLECLQKTRPIKALEDTHFSFVEYAGSNLAHWTWENMDSEEGEHINATKVCGQALVIADADVKGKARWNRLTEEGGFTPLITLGKEIESMIPAEILCRVLNHPFEGSYPYEKQVSPEITIQSICNDLNIEEKRGMPSFLKSGTLSDYWKKKLPPLVAKRIKETEFTDLPVQLQEWTEKIYNFILEKNGMSK